MAKKKTTHKSPTPCPVCKADMERRSRYYDNLPKPPNLRRARSADTLGRGRTWRSRSTI